MYVALAVFLEERESIFHITKVRDSRCQERMNVLCHDRGLFILILALFSELSCIIIKIPDSIFGISSTQYIFFSISFFLLSLILFIQAVLIISLIRISFSSE